MKKLSDYKIVSGAHVDEVEKLVKACIGDGWELMGSGYCCQDRYCQTLVKYEVSESDTDSVEVPSTPKAQKVRRGF